ncbi:MAG: hypothetical protein ABIP43_12700 [Nitrospiraceae bacterium]
MTFAPSNEHEYKVQSGAINSKSPLQARGGNKQARMPTRTLLQATYDALDWQNMDGGEWTGAYVIVVETTATYLCRRFRTAGDNSVKAKPKN